VGTGVRFELVPRERWAAEGLHLPLGHAVTGDWGVVRRGARAEILLVVRSEDEGRRFLEMLAQRHR
jgi:hypothetical protein